MLDEHADTEDLDYAKSLMIQKDRDAEIRRLVESHKDIVGKCYVWKDNKDLSVFPPMNKYIKIVTEREDSAANVTGVYVYQVPTYFMNYYSHMSSCPGDYYLGHFDFDFIGVDYFNYSNLVLGDTNYKEISEEYYLAAIDMAVTILKEELNTWNPDHNRMCNSYPFEDKWQHS